MTQGGNGMRPASGNDPYQGTGRVFLNNTTTPDKVFGTGMPTVQNEQSYVGDRIYGNENYINTNLQGYNQTGQNIINVDQLTNGLSQITPEAIEQLRRQQLVQSDQNANYQTYQQPYNPNQMYMQPPTIPTIQDMSAMPQPIRQPDLSTAEGTIDYLNSIAPESATAKTTNPLSSKLFVGLGIGVIVLVAVVAIVGALGNTGGGFSKAARNLGKSIANVQSLLEYGESNSDFTSSDMMGATAETRLIIGSHQYQLGKQMTLGVVDDKGKESEATADSEVAERLEQAKASGNLTTVYGDELKNRLDIIAKDLSKAYDAAKKKAAKQALSDAYSDVTVLIDRITEQQPTAGGQAVD